LRDNHKKRLSVTRFEALPKLFGGIQDRQLTPDQDDLETERLGEVGRRIGEGLRQGFGARFREELLAVDAQRRGGRVTVERFALRSRTGGPLDQGES